MRLLGINGVLRRKSTRITVANPNSLWFAHHCKHAWSRVTYPNQWPVADFTYVTTRSGSSYVAFITDVYLRGILGFMVSETKQSHFVLDELCRAINACSRYNADFSALGIIHHSDAGFQYTSSDLRSFIGREGISGSIGTIGDAYDNGLMDSTIGLYKSEEIDSHPDRRFDNWQDVEKATAAWVAWYNADRLQSSVGYVPPIEYEACYHQDHPQTDAPKPKRLKYHLTQTQDDSLTVGLNRCHGDKARGEIPPMTIRRIRSCHLTPT